MKYSKVTGTYLNFETGQRISTGNSYASQEFVNENKELRIQTFENGKTIRTALHLKAPKYLEFTSSSDDERIPVITGHFFSDDYEECVLSSSLSEQKIAIAGVVTKIDAKHALSTKTLIDSSGKTVGIMQEQIELISEAEFLSALDLK